MKDSLPDHWLHSPPSSCSMGCRHSPRLPPPRSSSLPFGNCSRGVKKNKKQKWASSWELANEGDQHQQAGRSMHMHVAPGGILRITVTCTARSLCLSLSHAHCTSPHLSLLSSSLPPIPSLLPVPSCSIDHLPHKFEQYSSQYSQQRPHRD